MDHLERSLFGTPLVYFTCLKIFQENYYPNNLFQRLQYVPVGINQEVEQSFPYLYTFVATMSSY